MWTPVSETRETHTTCPPPLQTASLVSGVLAQSTSPLPPTLYGGIFASSICHGLKVHLVVKSGCWHTLLDSISFHSQKQTWKSWRSLCFPSCVCFRHHVGPHCATHLTLGRSGPPTFADSSDSSPFTWYQTLSLKDQASRGFFLLFLEWSYGCYSILVIGFHLL